VRELILRCLVRPLIARSTATGMPAAAVGPGASARLSCPTIPASGTNAAADTVEAGRDRRLILNRCLDTAR
jgi:hypothetical protein